jgi:hypothetical protein
MARTARLLPHFRTGVFNGIHFETTLPSGMIRRIALHAPLHDGRGLEVHRDHPEERIMLQVLTILMTTAFGLLDPSDAKISPPAVGAVVPDFTLKGFFALSEHSSRLVRLTYRREFFPAMMAGSCCGRREGRTWPRS